MLPTGRWATLLLACAGSCASAPSLSAPRTSGVDATGPRRMVFDLHRRRPGPEAADTSQRRGRQSLRVDGKISDSAIPRELAPAPAAPHAYDMGNYQNVQYSLRIRIGSVCGIGTGGTGPEVSEILGQWFHVVADTGSYELWVPASNCTHCKEGVRGFSPSQSCTAKPLGRQDTLAYGDGTTASGALLEDSVQVGDLVVKNQRMLLVESMGDTRMRFDGIMGLSRHNGVAATQGGADPSFMPSLFREHPEIPQRFSLYFTGDLETPSKFIVGDADLTSYAKEDHFRYGVKTEIPFTPEWLTSVSSIGWSGTGVELRFASEAKKKGEPAMIDSGTSLLSLAPAIYDKLLPELTWRLRNCGPRKDMPDVEECDCPPGMDLSKLPWLVITVVGDDGRDFPLCMSPDEYLLEMTGDEAGARRCAPALQRGSATQMIALILGTTFIRSFYTEFDLEQHRIGFARSNRSPLGPQSWCSAHARLDLVRRCTWMSAALTMVLSWILAMFALIAPKGVHTFCSFFGCPILARETRDMEGLALAELAATGAPLSPIPGKAGSPEDEGNTARLVAEGRTSAPL